MHAIAVSQRGHGDSDKPDDGYRVEDFAADVVPLLDACKIERAILVGHSGSCLVARRVALDHPERIIGLVLEASPRTLRGNARLIEFIDEIGRDLHDPISLEFARSFITDTSSAGVQSDLVDLLVEDVLKVPAHVWHRTFSGLLQYDDTAELTRIRARTLLIWGDADSLVSRDTQDELLQAMPAAELLVYRDAGHTPRWEDPARFSSDLAGFVRGLREGR